jgi:mRNA interferase MazF
MGAKVKQYDVLWVNLDPVEGNEMAKTRPCVVISPDEMNDFLKTVTIAPLTSNLKPVDWRVSVFFDGQNGMVALDHIRSVAKSRLGDYMGSLKTSEIKGIKQTIKLMFVEP